MSEGDAVRVCVRVRPLIHREQGEEVNLLWKADNNTITQVDGTRSFSFDRVFHLHETTAQVYQEVAVPIIHSALQGYNGTIFAYGQTSSGKTYTMMGTPKNLGIIPQAVKEIFKIIHEIPNREFLLRVSYMEIYNETVTDLLCDDRKKKPLEIREDINRNVYVADLTEELVMAPEHIMEWIKKGEKNRHYGETKMNDHSSRSHTIFRMIVESRERNDPGNSENCDGAVMVSHLNLVDLAGSERASQTGAEGVRFKEGCNINRSLFILGQVIKKLSDGQVGGFINYRDSKLTRILQNSLGGNTKTVIICTVTPVSLDETLSTLQFASTAKHVRNTPHVNEVLDDQALLKRYRKEIMDLKKQLEELEASSEIKTHAMAKEEYSQLLGEIQQLSKEREDRIWNLTKIVVASSQEVNEDQRVKRKRRVTWAPGKLQDSLRGAGVPFEIDSKLAANSTKRPKFSEISPIPEIDDSFCTEFSDFDDASRVLDDFVQDADCSFGKVTRRGKTALSHSMIDFPSESTSSLEKDSSLQKCKEMEKKVAELEKQLSKLSKEYDLEVGKRESLEKETTDLKLQLKSRDEKDELVQTLEPEITSLKDQIHTQTEHNDQNPEPGDFLEIREEPTPSKTDDELELATINDSPLRTPTDLVCQDPVQEQLSSDIHDLCREQIQMLEQKIADLEGNESPENVDQNDFMESLQICDALMAEKQSAHEELAIMQNTCDHLVAENESLKKEIACLEKCLQENQETNEFEMLEKETQKEHEAQLIHEISSLKKVIENAEVYNQELENEVENKSKLLKELEKQIAELKRESEMLQTKVRYSDLSASMGDGEKLCEEVFQLRQSLGDAETVTRDAQREAAFLRSENLELKEQMDELSIRCEKREKDASDYEKKLEIEKSNYRSMQADLQKELQYAFNEINQLNGLMAGKVPKDLLSRFELDKKVADLSKQLASLSEEKNALEQEVASLSEYKSLPSEVELLKDQVQRSSEELILLKSEKEQSASILIDQKHKLLEQTEQIEKLTEEVTNVQAKCQEAEQQYSALKMLHESLEEKCSLTAEDLNRKDSEIECLLKEMDKLKHSLECIEQKLSATLEEKDELNNAKQTLETHVKELKESIKSSCVENENLQSKVNTLSSEVASLQQQTEKQDLEEKYNALVSENQQLQEQLHVSSLNVMQPENAEKLQELQAELNLTVQHRDELLVKLEELEAEKNNLKQDLNENIELSIETQDELRTTQEELKQQKQLISDLRKQLADCAGDPSPHTESQRNVLEEEDEVKCLQLQEQMLAMRQEEDALRESLKNLTAERDQLTLDLQENIEMSISTQDELRRALDELKVKTQLLESLNTQMNELKVEKNLSSTQEELQKCQEELNQQINLVNNLRMEASSSTFSAEKETTTDVMPSLEEEVLCLQEKLRQNNTEYQQLIQNKEKLEQDNDLLSSQVEGLMKDMKETQSMLDSLQNEKFETGRQLLDLQQQMEIIVQERDHLKNTQKRCISKLDQENQTENNDQAPLENELEQRTTKYHHEDLVQSNLALNNNLELLKMNLKNSEEALEMLRSEKNGDEQKINHLQRQVELNTEELENLKVAQQCLVSERDQLKEEFEKNAEKLIYLQEEVLQNANVHQELIQKKEELEQEQISLKCERENLMKTLTEAQSTLEHLQNEKLETEQQLTTLQQQMDEITQEKDELKTTKERLTLEMADFKEQLMNMEDNRQRIPENEENMPAQTICSHVFETSLKDMEAELASLSNEKLNLEEKLLSLQQHMEIMMQERDELKVRVQSLLSERDQLKEDLRENVEMSIETQDDLRKTQDDLQQQRQEVEELTCNLTSLEQKLSSVESELQEKVSLLKEVNNERQILQQTKEALVLELEHLHSDNKNKESALEESEKMRSEAGQKIIDLTVQLEIVSEERDQMQLTKEKLQKQFMETQDELKRTREELQQQEQTVEKLTNDISALEEKSSSLERELQEKIHILNKSVEDEQIFDQFKQDLTSKMEQLIEELKGKDLDLKQAKKENKAASQKILELTNKIENITQERDDLQQLKESLEEEAKKLQQYELEMAHLCQEQEQFQQLLQRVRSEKENIYASLQDQEKAVAQLQDELIAVKEERDESNAQLTEKVDEVNEMLQQISSLKEQMQQLHREMKEEKIKNIDLCENVDLLEKEIGVLRSILSEPAQEEDELAESTEILEKKNQEWKDLMLNLSTVYSDHYGLLNNLSSDLQSETEAQNQSMSSVTESLSSTHSRAFANLQTEHIKLNSQMQTLLNRFKVIYRTAAVKDEQYNLAKDIESELCTVQKKNEELLLQCESLEQHGTKWSEQSAEYLKFRELEFINQLIFKKVEVIKHVEDDFSKVQVALNSMESDLKEEIKCKKEFITWLEEFKGLHLDTKKLTDGVLEENKRIAGVIQRFTKTLKIIVQCKTKRDTMMYINGLETDLKEKREKNKELLQRMQQIAPSGDFNILEEENAQLRETLKNVQVDLKKMQCRIQDLENELSLAKADAKQKEQRALLLEEKLRSSTAESELPEMRAKMNEKEKYYQQALKEIQILQEKVSKGAAPYRDEIDSLKNQVVRVEMDRMKLSKSTDQQIASLKACMKDKEECLRKLKEQLRRTQAETETTICVGNSSSSQYPLTCGGGSGIVQSTALLLLQSENAALKREIAQYKKKLHQLSRNISSREDELKMQKDRSCETPSTLLSSLHHDEVMSHGNTDLYRATPVSPKKSEIPSCHIASPGKTGTHRKRVLSPSKGDMHKPQPMSPKNVERHSVPSMSPGNTGLYRKRPASPLKTDGPLFSTLTSSPCKKQNLPEKVDSPKDKFFDGRSKSLPYCPSKFFDNSTLGTLPDPCSPPSDTNPYVESDKDFYAGITTETSDGNNWWDQAGKIEKPNDCKTS